MCILFVYTNSLIEKGTYRLILISNRDEYYVRPSKSIQNITEHVIGGLDMEPGREGGMWLGLSTKQIESNIKLRIGVLLNIAGRKTDEASKDRGSIVRNYLTGNYDAQTYIDKILRNGSYKPHHFVAVELNEENKVICSSNVPIECHKFLGNQCLGFGNSPIETPYKKVENGCKRFQEVIDKYNNTKYKDELIKQLVDLLKWNHKHLPDPELKSRNKMVYEFLSSVYVYSEDFHYGTRAHSIILVDYDWNVEFVEIAIEQPIDMNNPIWSAKSINVKL